MSYSASYPYDTVVYITDTIGDFSVQGSGVLISPDEVLTASHVLYSSDLGMASDITVTPAFDMGAAPYGSATAVSFHYNPIQDPNGFETLFDSQIDYAVIHLSQPFPGLGTMDLQPGFQGGLANVPGIRQRLMANWGPASSTLPRTPTSPSWTGPR